MKGTDLRRAWRVLRLGRLWLFAFASSVVMLLALSSGNAGYAAVPNVQPQSACDLCSILPAGYTSTTTDAGGGEGKDFSCTGHYDPANVELAREPTLKVAEDFVLQFKNDPNFRPSSSYGELAYEAPESATRGYALAFKRGAIQVYIYTSLIGDNFENAKKAREYAQYVDSHLGAILGSCPPYSTPDPVAPTPTTAPSIVVPTDTVPPPTPTTEQTQLDLIVDHIEVVQVVQDEANRVQLYSGKKTLVRVFVGVTGATAPVPNVNVELRAFGWHDETGGLVPARNSPFTVPLAFDRNDLNTTVNFDLPDELVTSSTYPIEVKVNPDRSVAESDYSNNSVAKPLVFVEPFNLRIGYVRIGYTPPGSANVAWPTGPLNTYDQLMRKIYPTNQDHLQYYELPFRLNTALPLTTFAQQNDLLDRLRRRYDRLRSSSGDMAPDLMVGYLAWMGFGPTNVFTEAVGLAPVGTHTYVARAAWVVDYNGSGGVDSTERVLAHEVGHLLTLRHTGTPDPAPCWGPAQNNIPGYWEFGTGTTHEVGYDGATGNLVSDLFYDVLNYCPANETWISRFHYGRLFEGMRRYDFNDPDLMPDLTLDDVLVSGSLAQDGSAGHLDPIYSVASYEKSRLPQDAAFALGPGLASPLTMQQAGENCLHFTGASGPISERCFDISFEDEERGLMRDTAGFSLRVPYPKGTTSVTLLRKGKELDKRTASSKAPVLTITLPKKGDSWDGTQAISWTGSDPDGDKLTYEVHYSPNGGSDWFPLELDLQDTQYKINTAYIAGGDKVLLRVLASDGFNTAQADVGPIIIPNSPQWEPPARPIAKSAKPPQNPPANSGSESNALLLTLIGLGLALFIGVGVVATIVITRRSRAWQAPIGYPPSNTPPYTPPYTPPHSAPPKATQGHRLPPPPPRPLIPGAPNIPHSPGNPFAAAQMEYARLRAELTAGRITPQQFDAYVRQLTVRDVQGRTWMLARDTGQWLVYDGRGWVTGRPQ